MKFSDLAYIGRFIFSTDSLGSILCHRYSAETEVSEWLAENKDADAEAFVRFLITKLCVVSENLRDSSEERLTPEQSILLSKGDLERFCQNFINHNCYLFHNLNVDEYKVPTEQKNRFSIDIERLITDGKKRAGVEDNCSFLLYVLKDYHENYRRRMMEKLDSIASSFSVKTRNLLEENMRLSGVLLTKPSDYSPRSFAIPPIPHLQENPIFETNRAIGALAKEMSAVSQLVNNMNELGVQMSLDSALNAQKAQRWNTLMFGLGFLTLVVTAVFSYQGLQSANQSSAELERLIERQNVLLASQGETQKTLSKSLASLPKLLQESSSNDGVNEDSRKQPSEKAEVLANDTKKSKSENK
jgi:hypothetical protein